MTDTQIDISTLDDTVASRLKRVRTALGLKSAEMAEHLGFGASKYSNLESGRAQPKDVDIEQISDALQANGVPPGWIASGPPPTTGEPAEPGPAALEVWDISDEVLLGEVGRRLAGRGAIIEAYGEVGTDVEASVAAAIERTVAETEVPAPPPPPAAVVPAPVPAAPALNPFAPAPPAPSVQIPATATIEGQNVVVAFPFVQPAAPTDAERERTVVEMMLEQFGEAGPTIPPAFVPAQPTPVG